jgi:hypothetical protein
MIGDNSVEIICPILANGYIASYKNIGDLMLNEMTSEVVNRIIASISCGRSICGWYDDKTGKCGVIDRKVKK